MLRVFGCYRYGKNIDEEMTKRMKSLFELESNPWLGYLEFRQAPFFVIYEYIKSFDSQERHWINEKNDVACFVTGNIHAYEEGSLKPFSGINIAQWLVQKYEEKKSFSFVKCLRGVFNIILFYKGTLYLVNDILGVSPMYVSEEKKGMFFCSQPEPIIEAKETSFIDRKSVVDFFIYGFVPQGKTFINGLYNQKEASVIKIAGQKKEEISYGFLRPFDLKGASHDEKIQLIHDTFQEAVAIRAPQQEVMLDLTGGWDTRFILANLMKLNKKIIVMTQDGDPADLAVACQIARRFKLKHVILRQKNSKGEVFKDFNSKFSNRYSEYRLKKLGVVLKKRNGFKVTPFLIFRRFTGLFGTELFGYIFSDLLKSYNLDYRETAGKIFAPSFLLKCNGGAKGSLNSFLDELLPAFCFPKQNIYRYSSVTQIGRSYLNIHDGKGWERPVSFFSDLHAIPFADSKFFSLLSSFADQSYFNYRGYYEIYKRFYPEFLEIPWIQDHRCPKKSAIAEPSKLSFRGKRLAEDPKFMGFIKNKRIIRSLPLDLSQGLEKIYFLYTWLSVNGPLLSDSEQFL